VPPAVNELHEDLCYYYKRTRLTLQKNEWPPCQPSSIVNVALIHYSCGRTQQELVEISERFEQGAAAIDRLASSHLQVTKDISKMFSADPHDYSAGRSSLPPQCILIEGAPGIGKTVLAKEIVFRWANGELLQNCKLVFLVHLRDPQLQAMTSVKELIQLYTSSERVASDVNNYMEVRKGENVAFVFDGFDEFPASLQEVSFITDIIEREKGLGKVFYKSIIVVTSRPAATLFLHRVIDRRIEIIGFAKEERKKYISLSFSGTYTEKKQLDEYFKQHTFISDLCFIPLHLAILLFLFKMDSLPETLTEMNEFFIVHTIYRSMNRYNPSYKCLVKKIADLPETIYQFLRKLSKLAFSGLQRNQLVFSYDEIMKICPEINKTPEAFNGFGLLQAVQHYAQKGAGKTTSFNFLHLTLQEFLAAFYISSLSSVQQLSFMDKTFWDGHFKFMWMMYVGIVGVKSPTFSSFVSTCVDMFSDKPNGNLLDIETSLMFSNDILNDKTKCLYLFQCYMEAKSAEMPKEISSIFSGDNIELANVTLRPHHISSLIFFMSASTKQQWKILELRNCNLKSVGMNSLLEHFIKNEHIALNLEYVDLCDNYSSPWSVYCVIIRHCCVNSLTVCGDNGMEEHVWEIIDNLEVNATLKTLTLCNIGSNGLKSVKEILVHNTTLDVVNLSWKKIAHDRINDKKSVLINAKYPHDKVKERESIILYNDRVMDVNILYDGYHRCSPEVVALSYNNNINDFAIVLITFGLCNTTSVARLDLSCCQISYTGITTVSNCFKTTNSLRELDLSLNKVTIKGMYDLQESINNVTLLLEYVDFSRNSSSPWGVYCVIIRQCCVDNLTICGDDGMEEYIKDIGDSLEANVRLQSLTLCSIGQSGVNSLKEILASNITLNEVNLSWKKHSNQGLKDKRNILLHVNYIPRTVNRVVDVNVLGGDYCGPVPQKIDFSSKDAVDDDMVALLAFGLYNNTTVHTLDISHSEISDDGAIMISKCLENNNTLNNLNLSRNMITAVGAVHIGKAIEINSSLKIVDISYNKISDGGALAFSKCLEKNNTLKELDLSLNRITKSGMEHLLESVHSKSTAVLEYFDLSGNYSSPWGVYCGVIGKCCADSLTVCGDYDMQKYIAKLADSLEANAALTSLTLCSIGRTGIESTKELLLRNTTLNEVNLSWEKMRNEETKRNPNSLIFRKLQVNYGNNRVVDIRVLYNSKFSCNTVDLRNTSALAKNALALIKFGLCDQAVFKKNVVSQSRISDRVLTFIDALGNSNIATQLNNTAQNRFVMLQYVDLMICNTNISPWGVYSVIIKHCCVNSLTLCGEYGMEKYLKEITDSLNTNPILESLTLCRIGRNGVESLSQILTHSMNLNEVNLSWEKLSIVQIKSKRNILIQSTHSSTKVVSINVLRKCYDDIEILPGIIDFSNENVNDDAMAVIAFGLCNNITVQRVDVSQTKISDNGAISIGNSLKKNSVIKELDMSLNKISSIGMNHMRESFKDASAITLEYVDLSENIDSSPWRVYSVIIKNCCVRTITLIGDAGMDKCVSEIAESLESNTKLESMTLCYIGSVGIRSIETMSMLVNNMTLKVLNLSWMKINNEGTKNKRNILLHTRHQFSSIDYKVSHAQTRNFRVLDVNILYDACCQPTPHKIDLHRESVSDDVVSVIAFGLYQNTTVQSLDVSHNELSSAGAIAISKCLKCNSTLQHLNISHNSIQDNGAIAISDCLKYNSTLQSLNMSHNNKINSVTAQKVSEAIASNSTLLTLEI